MTFLKPWAPACEVVYSHQSASKKPTDLVSICVTNYNYSKYLVECLDSLARQTHKPLDLVVVDDRSLLDDSIEVASEWMAGNAKRFHRAMLVSHVRNQGPSEARNTAFSNALSDYVFVIDADNQAYPRAIARLYEAVRAGSFDAAYSQIEVFGDRKEIGRADIWDPEEIVRDNYVDVMGIIRKSAWDQVGGYSHIEEGWEDYDFWLKFVDAGLCPGYVPEILCRYRVHGRSRTAVEAFIAHDQLKLIMAFRHPPSVDGPVLPAKTPALPATAAVLVSAPASATPVLVPVPLADLAAAAAAPVIVTPFPSPLPSPLPSPPLQAKPKPDAPLTAPGKRPARRPATSRV